MTGGHGPDVSLQAKALFIFILFRFSVSPSFCSGRAAGRPVDVTIISLATQDKNSLVGPAPPPPVCISLAETSAAVVLGGLTHKRVVQTWYIPEAWAGRWIKLNLVDLHVDRGILSAPRSEPP